MSMDVLRSRQQIAASRRVLAARGISRVTRFPLVAGALRRLGLRTATTVGDSLKSWDIERSATFIEQNVPRTARVLDLGADSSELPYVLQGSGYRRILGIDRSPALRRMPPADGVSFLEADFHQMPLRQTAVDVVTAISVIEHGYAPERLLAEVGRVLRPGGYFVFSCDYWPEKIDTQGLTVFGMSWMIFSKQELLALVGLARQFDLHLHGPVDLDASEAPIRWNDRSYTFAWAVLRKEGPPL